jgi:hypothetical protein
MFLYTTGFWNEPELVSKTHESLRGVTRCRGCLKLLEKTGIVPKKTIGEGAADIDAYPLSHFRSSLLRSHLGPKRHFDSEGLCT